MHAILIAFSALVALARAVDPPNIIYILTDDQDETLHSMQSMPLVKELISDVGVRFPNMFVTTPTCCPSRSAIYTGRYGHNTGAHRNVIEGGCSSTDFQQNQENQTYPIELKKAGYSTFFAGKYLNQYGNSEVGGAAHVPPGWDWWNGMSQDGDYYYNYSLSVNGTEEKHGDKYEDYMTTVIAEKVFDYLRFAAENKKPFYMQVATTAPHGPFYYLPRYENNFTNEQAPRTPSYNVHATDKHWIMMQALQSLPTHMLNHIDVIFRNRWRALQSVDLMVEQIVTHLTDLSLLHNTIIIYSSDNGFHMGQFCFPAGKIQPYETDIRVPLAAMGPGIKKGIVSNQQVTTIDMGPTILDLAGVTKPDWLEGVSFASVLKGEDTPNAELRKYALVEYWGDPNGIIDPECRAKRNENVSHCLVQNECMCTDAANDTYTCVRHLEGASASNVAISEMYCEFQDDVRFKEFYNLIDDPYQITNTFKDLSNADQSKWAKILTALNTCQGKGCIDASLGNFDF